MIWNEMTCVRLSVLASAAAILGATLRARVDIRRSEFDTSSSILFFWWTNTNQSQLESLQMLPIMTFFCYYWDERLLEWGTLKVDPCNFFQRVLEEPVSGPVLAEKTIPMYSRIGSGF